MVNRFAELTHQPALAQPNLTRDQGHVATLGSAHIIERLLERLQDCPTTDHRNIDTGQTTHGMPVRLHAQWAKDPYGPRGFAKGHHGLRFIDDQRMCALVNLKAHEDCICTGCRHQSHRQIKCIAHDGAIDMQIAVNLTDNDRAGMNADA